jgi:hypothetical protein
MPIKQFNKLVRTVRWHLAPKEQFGIIVKQNDSYDYWLITLPEKDESLLYGLICKEPGIKVVETIKLTEDFTLKQLKRRIALLNRRELRERKKSRSRR